MQIDQLIIYKNISQDVDVLKCLSFVEDESLINESEFISQLLILAEKYELHGQLFQSLLTYINENYSASNAIGVVDECIEPTLKKMGYESLIPKLKEQIIKSQEEKEMENSWNLSDGEKAKILINSGNNEAKSKNKKESYELYK